MTHHTATYDSLTAIVDTALELQLHGSLILEKKTRISKAQPLGIITAYDPDSPKICKTIPLSCILLLQATWGCRIHGGFKRPSLMSSVNLKRKHSTAEKS
jgi:hypothetical protein